MNEKKVIIVDDDEDLLALLESIFKKAGFEVRIANSGNDFFSLLKTFLPDAVVLDMIMPKMNGEDICKKIRETKEYENIKIFFLSVVVMPEDQLASMKNKYNISGYFNKPFQIKELAIKIKEAI